ncbi:MAG: SH3 domain-containing protein, partial [bacterium]
MPPPAAARWPVAGPAARVAPAGQLILALIDVAQQRDKARPRSIKYLQALLGSERWFPPALGVAAKLSGLATENEILVAIDRAKPSSKTPDANVDVDRDGKNDTYVEPLTRTAKIYVPTAAFYEKPDTSSKKVGSLPKGSGVRIIGKASPAWFAIELNNRTAFAQVID